MERKSERKCQGCGRAVPEERRKDSRFCGRECREKFRRQYFARGADATVSAPLGRVLLVVRGQTSGLLQISDTAAARTRIRTARASCSEGLDVVGAVAADDLMVKRFRARFAGARVRGSWYHPTPELLAWVQERTGATVSIDTTPLARHDGVHRHHSATAFMVTLRWTEGRDITCHATR
jgi:predicted nucleic acid-binding Zn ribbon protein